MAQGFGVTVWCMDTLRTGRFVSGALAVAQSCFRRLTTPRGMLRGSDEALTFGLDLAGLVGALGTEQSLRALPPMIRAELLKDERLAEIAITAAIETNSDGTLGISIEILGTLHDEQGEFTLTLSVTDAAVKLIQANAT